jgi:microcystin-dependent protein
VFYRDFHALEKLPADYTRALEQFIGLFSNVLLVQVNTTTIAVPANATNGQASLGIEGLWRYNTAEVTAVHPGGSAGTYDIVAATTANSFTVGAEEEEDHTDYSWSLHIETAGKVPSGGGIAATRKLGEVDWNGTRITAMRQLVPGLTSLSSPAGGNPIGEVKGYAGEGDPDGWHMLCDGRAISRTTYALLFAVIGTKYGAGNGTTTFNIPDLRGRVLVGPDNMGTAMGAAGRVSSSNAIGQSSGSATHTMTEGEMPSHVHTITDLGHKHSYIDPGHNHGERTGSRFLIANAGGDGSDVSHASGGGSESTHETANSFTGLLIETAKTGITINAKGGGAAFNIMQPYQVLNSIIRVL